MELFKQKNTQALLSRFLSGETRELLPVYDKKVGYRYPTVEAIVGDHASTEVFLKKLHDAGILEKKLFDKVVICPKCTSASVSIHYCCPYCRSFDIQKSSLIEHVKCGYMDVEENFLKAGKLICPKCHDELKKLDADHRKAGIWCVCKDCGKSFDIPVSGLFCRDCLFDFTFEDAVIKDVYSYRLKEEAKQEANLGYVLVMPLKEFLAGRGLEVEGPAFLKGKSGANHMFDVVARSRDPSKKTVVLDLATSSEEAVSEQSVIALFAKIFDVSPGQAYLVAIPKMSDNGKKMAELYNIRVIEAKDQKEAVSSLSTMMNT